MFHFRLTQAEFDLLSAEARATGVPVSTLVRYAIAEWVESVQAPISTSASGDSCITPRSARS